LTRQGEKILLNERPLRFFHYSGYEVDRPWILNKYYAERPRVVLSDQPVVLELCEEYRRQILEFEGAFDRAGWRYRFDQLADGTPVTQRLRAMYRKCLIDSEQQGTHAPPAPFVGDESHLIDWFQEPVRNDRRVNRFMLSMWESRPDLQNAFPSPLGADEAAFVQWAMFDPTDQDLADYRGLLPTESTPSRQPIPVCYRVGLNVAGYLKAEMGVGESARLPRSCSPSPWPS
jgi:hypothetical protein